MTGYAASMYEQRNVVRLVLGKPEEKRSLGTLTYKWGDNIRMDLTGIECTRVDWIYLVQYREK
jgi:hypothetical protein